MYGKECLGEIIRLVLINFGELKGGGWVYFIDINYLEEGGIFLGCLHWFLIHLCFRFSLPSFAEAHSFIPWVDEHYWVFIKAFVSFHSCDFIVYKDLGFEIVPSNLSQILWREFDLILVLFKHCTYTSLINKSGDWLLWWQIQDYLMK